jgi:hypothetical protein
MEIMLFLKNFPEGIGHGVRFKHGRCHLIQEGLKGMEIIAVQQNDLQINIRQLPGQVQSGKTAADNYQTRLVCRWDIKGIIGYFEHPELVWRQGLPGGELF